MDVNRGSSSSTEATPTMPQSSEITAEAASSVPSNRSLVEHDTSEVRIDCDAAQTEGEWDNHRWPHAPHKSPRLHQPEYRRRRCSDTNAEEEEEKTEVERLDEPIIRISILPDQMHGVEPTTISTTDATENHSVRRTAASPLATRSESDSAFLRPSLTHYDPATSTSARGAASGPSSPPAAAASDATDPGIVVHPLPPSRYRLSRKGQDQNGRNAVVSPPGTVLAAPVAPTTTPGSEEKPRRRRPQAMRNSNDERRDPTHEGKERISNRPTGRQDSGVDLNQPQHQVVWIIKLDK